MAVENTRLVEALKEVPEKTRMQSARFSTEQSYTDWQLSLAAEQLTKAQRALEQFLEQPVTLPEKQSDSVLTAWQEAECRWQEEYEPLQQRYTEACLLWYEKWQEYEEAFDHYRE